MQKMWCKMKTRRGGIIILVCGVALSITGFSLAYYPDNILFPPSDTPIIIGRLRDFEALNIARRASKFEILKCPTAL